MQDEAADLLPGAPLSRAAALARRLLQLYAIFAAVVLALLAIGLAPIKAGSKLKDLAAEAQTALQSAVHANFTAGSSMAQAKGLSVWLPSDYEWSDRKENYKTLRFGKDSHWTKLLEALYGE